MKFDHFALRLLTTADDEAFFNLVNRNRARLETFFSGTVGRTRTQEDTYEYLVEIQKKIERKSYLPYFLIDKDANSLAGFIDLKNIDWNIPKGELGYFMDLHYSNKGIGSRMLKTFSDYCFDHYGFKKLFLRTHETNQPARKIAEHCGFEVEGKLRRDYKTMRGDLVDLLYYGKIS